MLDLENAVEHQTDPEAHALQLLNQLSQQNVDGEMRVLVSDAAMAERVQNLLV